MENEFNELKEMVAASRYLVAFTGAGLSAESGIPTYRGAGGLWQKFDPDKYASYDYFLTDPTYYWRFFKEVRFPVLAPAEPNPAHLALAKLEGDGRLKQVITQNIDGLHQLAGSTQVCELHGNTRRIVCLECGEKLSMEEVYPRLETEMPPRCACTGLLKPDVVLFGESLPQQALQTAWRAAAECDLFMVVGSSLLVHPAAQIPVLAKEQGARLVILNIDPTPLDGIADLVINEEAGRVLSSVV
jgi:NAD-dependent deacetylase